MNADIYGKWVGSYSYDQSEIWESNKPGDVPFEMEIEPDTFRLDGQNVQTAQATGTWKMKRKK